MSVVFLVIALVALAAILAMRYDGHDSGLIRKLWLIPIALFVLALIAGSLVVVQAGHRGVLLRFGRVESVLSEGLNPKLFLIDRVVMMSVQTELYSAEATAASRDLQDVKTSIGLNYRLIPEQAGIVYQTLGVGYIARIAAPAVQEVVKSVTARYDAEDLILRREMVKADIATALTERLAERGIVAEIVNITDFVFSEDFTRAIEQKVVAQQRVLQAQFDLDKATIEAQQILVKARAQDEANLVLTRNLTPMLLQYILIDRLGKDIKVMVVPSGQGLALDISTLYP